MLRGGAAAAAQQPRAGLGQFPLRLGKRLRPGGENRPPALHARQARIGRAQQGTLRHPANPAQQRKHLRAAQAAIQSQSRHAQAVQQHGHGFHRASGEQPPVDVRHHGGQNGQITGLPGSQHRRFHLVGVAHGFDEDQVGPGFRAPGRRLAVQRHRLLEGQFPIRGQELSRGAHVKGSKAVPRFLHSLARQLHPRLDHFLQLRPEAGSRGPKGVRRDNVAPCRQVGAMHLRHRFRMRQVPPFRRFSAGESGRLKHGTHAAIHKYQPFSQQFLQFHGFPPPVFFAFASRDAGLRRSCSRMPRAAASSCRACARSAGRSSSANVSARANA